MIKRDKRAINRDRIDIQYLHFEFFLIYLTFFIQQFIVRSNRTTIFKNVFDTIQFFVRRKF